MEEEEEGGEEGDGRHPLNEEPMESRPVADQELGEA